VEVLYLESGTYHLVGRWHRATVPAPACSKASKSPSPPCSASNPRSADLESAVSPNSIRQGLTIATAFRACPARRITNPRYSRFQICTTVAVHGCAGGRRHPAKSPLPEQTLVLGMGAARRVPSWDAGKGQFVPVMEANLTARRPTAGQPGKAVTTPMLVRRRQSRQEYPRGLLSPRPSSRPE